jgi:GxxExxY protein
MAREEAIGKAVLNAAIRVHSELGPGLLESAYEACLAYELSSNGYELTRQVRLPVRYRGRTIEAGYRLDLLVEKLVIVELKTVDSFSPVHVAQLLSYLKLGNLTLGYLLNFNVAHMREGMKRVVLGHQSCIPSRP